MFCAIGEPMYSAIGEPIHSAIGSPPEELMCSIVSDEAMYNAIGSPPALKSQELTSRFLSLIISFSAFPSYVVLHFDCFCLSSQFTWFAFPIVLFNQYHHPKLECDYLH